ncbi:MAG: N-glycosylase/DNA lyase [Tepidanaerobacteraceae bacterium]|nr:N-glycosylase/DNA lyase [Tepidanaerobacteraceae bacterium]
MKYYGEGKSAGFTAEGMAFIIENIQPFNLGIMLDGGQTFLWNRQKDESYIGVISGRVLKVRQQKGCLIFDSFPEDENIVEWIRDYFDLDRDYNSIEKWLCEYKELIPAVKYCSGNRILHQDPWETTVSFIISANNSIPNIKKTIARICEYFGEPLQFEGKTYYAFPLPKVLAEVPEGELRKTRCGFRAKYIAETARMVANGEVGLSKLHELPTQKAREQLMRLPGVGRKVADCILLFSMQKYDAFPIDVWIKRVLEHLYFKGQNMSQNKLQEFTSQRFGSMKGFAQHYLFHYTRTLWGKDIAR